MNSVNSTTQIYEMIEATINSINNMNDVVVKNKIDTKKIANLEKILKSTKNIITAMDGVLKDLQKFDKLKIDFKKLKSNINHATNAIKAIISFSNAVSKMTVDNKLNEKLNAIKTVVDSIGAISASIAAISVVKTILVLPGIILISLGIFAVITVMTIIAAMILPLVPIVLIVYKGLTNIFSEFGKLVATINSVKTGKAGVKLIFMQFIVRKLMRIISDLSWFNNYDIKSIVTNLGLISVIAWMLGNISEDLSRLKFNSLVSFKLKEILSSIKAIRKIVRRINRIPNVSVKTLLSIWTLSLILKQLVTVFTNVAILGLLSIPVLLGMPFILLSLLGLRLICTIIKKINLDGDEFVAALALVPITLALIIVATNLALISLISMAIQFKSLLSFVGALAVMVGIVWLFGKFDKTIQEASLSIILFSVSCTLLTVAALAIVVVSNLALSISLIGIGIMALVLIGLVFVFKLLGNFSSDIALGAIALIVMSAALLVFAIPLFLLNKILPTFEFVNIGKLLLLIGGLAVAFGVAGLFVVPILLGAVALMAIGVALTLLVAPFMLFAKTLQMLKDLKITEEEVKFPIQMMGVLVDTINETFGLKALVTLPLAAAKVMMLIPIASAITNMAKTLKSIASLNMATEWDEKGRPTKFTKMQPQDFIDAATNATNICKIMANMFGDEDTEVVIGGQKFTLKPITTDMLSKISLSTAFKIKMLSSITSSIGNMAKVLQSMAFLTIPTEFDEKGNPKGFVKMQQKDFAEATSNIALIATTLISAISSPEIVKRIDDMGLLTIAKIKFALNAVSSIDSMVEVIKQMAGMSIPVEYDKDGKPTKFRLITPEERELAMKNVVTLMTEFLEAMTSEKLTATLDNMSRRGRKNLETIMSSATGIKSLIETVKFASDFDKSNIANGIAVLKEAVLQYVGLISDLFIERWGWEVENKKILGINVKLPIYTVIDKAQVDMGNLSYALENIERVTETIDPIKNLVNLLDTFKEISTNKTTITTNMQDLGDVLVSYINAIGVKKTEKELNYVKLKSNTDQFIKVIDKVNKVDTTKVKSVTEMFSEMSRFSESIDGNLDKLSEILSDRLIDALEKLSGILEGTKNTTGKTSVIPSQPVQTQQVNNEKENKLAIQNANTFKNIESTLEEINSIVSIIKSNTDKKNLHFS